MTRCPKAEPAPLPHTWVGRTPYCPIKTLTGLLPYILPKCTEQESEAKEKKPLTWFTDQNPFA